MSRYLTEDEIEYILDFIDLKPNIPLDTAQTIMFNNKNRLYKQLKNHKVYPQIIPTLKSELFKTYQNSIIQPGESVGVICAQSIGEKQTQTTLNTFHKAGMSAKTVTMGVPRFQELINATKKPRNINHKIYFKNKNKTIEELRENVGHSIVGLTFNDIAISIKPILNKAPEKWYKVTQTLYNIRHKYKHCISIKLNMYKLFEFKLTLLEIAEYLETEFDDLYCIISPSQFAQIDIFIDTDNIELPQDRILFINHKNVIEIYLEECVRPTLENIHICGIPCILEIFYTQENNEWICETNGSNSRNISSQFINYKKLLSLPNIDFSKTLSNNVWDIYEVFGIEAARQFLIEEFMSIMDGINFCHTYLLVDRMTYSGNISSITRYTMKKDESGPFGRASFEETMDNFLNAAAQGEIEPTEGVSASIICGKRASIGTGMIDLAIDFENLPIIKE